MKLEQRRLLQKQLDKKLAVFKDSTSQPIPGQGWVHAIREAIGMSLKQLGQKIGITPQGAKDIERREENGSITLQRLREVAWAMDLQLVYALVPREGSLDQLVEKRARELAREIVLKTAHSMRLEDQAIDQEALEQAILERTRIIKQELPRKLWD